MHLETQSDWHGYTAIEVEPHKNTNVRVVRCVFS